MRGGIRKVEGVRDVRVSLNEGLATIQFAERNRARIEQIWKVVRDNGFSPRAATITAVGTLRTRGDTVEIVIGGSSESLRLAEAPTVPGQLSELKRRNPSGQVHVLGDVVADLRGRVPDVLLIRSFALQ